MNSPAIWRAVCVHDRTGCHRSSLYFWGHHIFFYARHPTLVIEWVIVFCLFVCSFRNSQEYLRQMLLVFFFAFYAHLSHANSMSAYDRWQALTRVIIATFSVSREHKRMQEKDHFFLALFGFYWHGTTTFWIWHDAQTKYYRKVCFLLSLVETNKFQQQKHIKSTLIYNLNWQTLNVKRTIYISNVTMNERENLKIF